MNEKQIVEELHEYISTLQIIDTHEHLPMETERNRDSDVLSEWLTHYFSCDLISAGLSDQDMLIVRDSSRDLLERWDLVEPYWQAAKSTGYGRSLEYTADGLYGIKTINRETIIDLDRAFREARKRGNWYHHVFKEKSRIALSIVDSQPECDRNFFVSAVRFDNFITPGHLADLRTAANGSGIKIHSLGDWCEALRVRVKQMFEKESVVAIKHGLAYQRSLFYEKASQARAEDDFNELFRGGNSPDWRAPIKCGQALQNYMFHKLLSIADEMQLTVQIHTGLQEGNGNIISDANPTHLANCFLEYSDVTFDIFHMGYPYMLELSSLAKNFRNVNIDMCWGHIISPEAARNALVEWLDSVPANKISAFGGDYCFIDAVYGHQLIARRNVAASLSRKVIDGSFNLERAKEIAEMLFFTNPVRIFKLKSKLSQP